VGEPDQVRGAGDGDDAVFVDRAVDLDRATFRQNGDTLASA
jgi:hypothetical protein